MKRKDFYEQEKMKKLIYVFGITLILSIVIFLTILVMYNKKMKTESIKNLESLGKIEEIVSNEEIEETSASKDLTIQDALSNNISSNKTVKKEPIESTVKNNTNMSNSVENIANTISNIVIENNTIESNIVEEKDLSFMAPVAGEIIKDFAQESLIYSKTLEEWTTHTGIDIKADKTSVVMASEGGTVESIKNDPRYGLTITISHRNGFKTIYSNLLSTEFVNENEIVEKGQTIGTVGNTASFEIAEDSHLHFEIYKDGNVVNPTIYLK